MTFHIHNIKDPGYPCTPHIYLSVTASDDESDIVQAFIRAINEYAKAKFATDVKMLEESYMYLKTMKLGKHVRR